jgi:transcriptional regulator with GAF, ATPase, and Fis domain
VCRADLEQDWAADVKAGTEVLAARSDTVQNFVVRAQDPGDRFAAIARDLLDQPTQLATVERIVEVAVEVVRGCDHAGISLVEGHGFRLVAATDPIVEQAAEQQYLLNEGPSLDSIRNEATVRVPRLSRDDRWPEWAPWASAELGLNSMLCFQLFTAEHPYGSLNLYSDKPAGFDAHDEVVGLALAAHAAVAIASSRRVQSLNAALASRTAIGQAEGILMERFGMTAEQAFSVLVRVSQDENRRLTLVAEELVKTGETPGTLSDQPDSALSDQA